MTPTLDAPELQNTGLDAIQEHPSETDPNDPTAQFKLQYGDRYEKLPQSLVNAIREQIKTLSGQDRYMRRIEVLRDRKLRFYEKGIQHIFETNQGGFVQATPGGTLNGVNGTIQCGEFVDDYDITGPYSRIQQSVITQTLANPAFEPDDSSRPGDKAAATAAERYWETFLKSNDLRELQTQAFRMFQTSGRAVSWTRTEADAQKFGVNANGDPKRKGITSIHGTLEHKCPILAKSLSDCLYNTLYDDPNVLQMQSEYPDFRDKIKANAKGLGEDEYERMARIGVLQGTRAITQVGESIGHIATRANCWLRLGAFADQNWDQACTDCEGNQSIRDTLKMLFPDGIHAVFVGDTYVGSWSESVDDHLEIQFPYVGDGMFGRAILDPFPVIQDAVNDDMNAFRECANYGWPSRYINADEEQFKALEKQISAPYMLRQLELRPGEKMQDTVLQEDPLEIPQTLFQLMEFMQGPFAQFILACPPALWGSAMADQKTSSGYHLAASQAMGQMGLWFGRIQRLFAKVAYQAALCAAKNPDEAQQFATPSADGMGLSAISKELFRAYPDDDSNFPESVQQKRAVLDGILEFAVQAPEVGMALLAEPRNWKTILTLKGFGDIVVPQAEAFDKAQFAIEQLLQQDPMRDPIMVEQAQMLSMQTGRPFDVKSVPPSGPSITPGPLDYHQWEFEACQSWLNSQACRDELAKGNNEGVQNVLLYAQAQQAMVPPPPMPMLPAGAPGKPAPKPAGPQQPPPAPEAPVAAPLAA